MGIQNRSAKYIKLFIYLVLVVLINVAATTLFFRVDLTSNNIYSISKASKEVVATLSEPLTINIFFTKNLPAPYNTIERYLHDLLEEYAIAGNRYFNYRFYDVSPEGETVNPSARENQKLARNYGIHPVQIQVFEEDEVKFKKAYMGMVLIHGDMVEKIPTITSVNGLEYKLTTAIQKLNNKISAMLNLSGKVKVKLFLSSSLKEVAPFMGIKELPEYPEKLKDIVQKISDKNYGKLTYEYIDPSNKDNTCQPWEKYSLMHLKWPDIPDRKIHAGSGFIGLVMEYGKNIREIPILNILRIPIIGIRYSMVKLDRMEEIINENVETLVNINPNLGYLADHGTLDLSSFSPMGQKNPEALSIFSQLISKTYSIKRVNLKNQNIPESLNCLMIVQPTEKFTDYELYQIDQALMRGTNLALFTDAFKEIKPGAGMQFNRGPTLIPFDSGLGKLLDHYGITIKKSYVMDENCHKQKLPRSMGGGERPIYFVPLIKNKFINHDLEFMKNIKGLIAVKISPLELDEQKAARENLKVYRLFSSSEHSWEMRDRINLNPMFLNPPPSKDQEKSMPLAYLIQGRFPSYFAGKPIPEKKSDKDNTAAKDKKEKKDKKPPAKNEAVLSKIKGEGGFIEKGRPAKIFIMGSSEMLKDNVLDLEGNSPNDVFILNTLDVLNHRENIALMRSKVQQFNPLTDTSAATKMFIKTFNIAGLPVLVVFWGMVVWLRRRSRRKKIRLMFQK